MFDPSLIRKITFVLSMGMFGSFLLVSIVHLMWPQDPINPGPAPNYIALLWISFVIISGLSTIAYRRGGFDDSSRDPTKSGTLEGTTE